MSHRWVAALPRRYEAASKTQCLRPEWQHARDSKRGIVRINK